MDELNKSYVLMLEVSVIHTVKIRISTKGAYWTFKIFTQPLIRWGHLLNFSKIKDNYFLHAAIWRKQVTFAWIFSKYIKNF